MYIVISLITKTTPKNYTNCVAVTYPKGRLGEATLRDGRKRLQTEYYYFSLKFFHFVL